MAQRKTKIKLISLLITLIICFSCVIAFSIEKINAYANSESGEFIIDKNPIEAIKVNTNITELKVGESANLSVHAYPENANLTLENIEYRILVGEEYAKINGNIITINKNALVGEVVIVDAIVDGVVSNNKITYTIVKTEVESLEILNSETILYEGERLQLNINVLPSDATNSKVGYTIVEGKKYASALTNGTIKVNNDLPGGNLSIKVRVTSLDNREVYDEITFTLYKPVKKIILTNKDIDNVEQNRAYLFAGEAQPITATNANESLKYSIDVDTSIATINQNGLLTVKEDAPIGTIITIKIEAADNVYIEKEVKIVPVYAEGIVIEKITSPTHGNKYLPGDTIEITPKLIGANNITESNQTYYIEISDNELAFIEGTSVLINSIDETRTENLKFTIYVKTNQNGKIFEDSVDIEIYIPVESIQTTQLQYILNEGGVYNVLDLISTQLYPVNCENKTVNYSIVCGEAKMINNTIKINDELSGGNTKLVIKVEIEGIEKNITFDLHKPIREIKLTNFDLTEVEQQEKYSFKANIGTENTTYGDDVVTYSINVDDSVATIDEEGILTIAKDAPIGSEITITVDAVDIFRTQTVTVVPVYATSIEIIDKTKPSHGNKYLQNDVIDIMVELGGPYNITECNKNYYIEVSDTELARVDNDKVIINKVDENKTNLKLTIYVKTNQNSTTFKDSVDIEIYIPVTNLEITQSQTTLEEGKIYNISDLISTQLYPANCENKTVNYSIVSGEAKISNNTIIINDDLSNGDTILIVKVKAEDIEKKITFDLYKPVKEIKLKNTPDEEVEQAREYDFGANAYPINATRANESLKYSIDVDTSVATINQNGLLTIKDDAPIETIITIKIDATDGVYLEKIVTIVPVYADEIDVAFSAPTKNNKYEPGKTIDIDVWFIGASNISESNKVYEISVSDYDLAIVQDNKVVIKDVDKLIQQIENNDKLPKFTISVTSEINGITDAKTCEVNIYIPVMFVEVQAKTRRLDQGGSYVLSDIFETIIYPTCSDVREVDYLVDNGKNATLNGNILTINEDLSAGKLVLIIDTVEVDGCAGSVAFNLYKPATSIKFTCDNYHPISCLPSTFLPTYNYAYIRVDRMSSCVDLPLPQPVSMQRDDYVNLNAYADSKASSGDIKYTIIHGIDNISDEYKNGDLLEGSAFAVKRNLSVVANLDKKIVIRASRDDVYKDITLYVYIPNEKITCNISTLSRGNNKFEIINTPNADDTSWKVDYCSDGMSVDPSGNILVDNNIPAGTTMTLVVRSLDKLGTYSTITFTTVGLSEYKGQLVFINSDDSPYANKFNLIIDSDSEGVLIKKSTDKYTYQQLHAGRSTKIEVLYNGELLSNYGLKLICNDDFSTSVRETSENSCIVFEEIGEYYVEIYAGEYVSGKTTISFEITVSDGDEEYTINFNDVFNVFQPIVYSNLAIEQETIYEKETDLTLVSGNSVSYVEPTYSLKDFCFRGYSENESTVSLYGHLRLNDGEPRILVHYFDVYYDQVYNGTTIKIEYKKLCVRVRSIKTPEGMEVVLVDGYSATITLPEYSRSGYEVGDKYASKVGYDFAGYNACIRSEDGSVYRISYYDKNGKLCVKHSDYSKNIYCFERCEIPIKYAIRFGDYVGDGCAENESLQKFTYDDVENQIYIRARLDKSKYTFTGVKVMAYVTSIPYEVLDDTIKCTILNICPYDECCCINFTYEEINTGGNCVASGTMITLADGTQKAVEDLDGSEMLLVWDFDTGGFSYAPILFTDYHGDRVYKVIHLYFEDETDVEVISDHGFWDYTLNKYVYISEENAEEFIGHYFDMLSIDENGNQTHKKVQYTKVVIEEKYTGAWSPVTYGYLCYYVNGLLSVPAKTEGFVNIFEVDDGELIYNKEKKAQDIEMYGLADYEIYFADIIPIEIYYAFRGEYILISMAKGNLTEEDLQELITTYSKFFEEEEG